MTSLLDNGPFSMLSVWASDSLSYTPHMFLKAVSQKSGILHRMFSRSSEVGMDSKRPSLRLDGWFSASICQGLL